MAEKENIIKMTTRMERELHSKLKIQAIKEKLSLKDLVIRICTEYLEKVN